MTNEERKNIELYVEDPTIIGPAIITTLCKIVLEQEERINQLRKSVHSLDKDIMPMRLIGPIKINPIKINSDEDAAVAEEIIKEVERIVKEINESSLMNRDTNPNSRD